MAFKPVKPRVPVVEAAPFYVSVRPYGTLYIGESLRHHFESAEHTHLELEFDAVERRLRFKPSNAGSPIRYNVVSIGKDLARNYTMHPRVHAHRTRRWAVEQATDGWWYLVRSLVK